MSPIALTAISKKFCLDIVNDFIKYENSYNKMIQQINIHSKSFSDDNINNIPDYDHYPDTIKNSLNNMSKHIFTCPLNIDSRNIQLHIIYNSNITNYKKYIINIIKPIFLWLSYASKHSNKQCSQTLNIYLSMTPSLKLLPSYNTIISSNNANSAFTYSCKTNNTIHVFREEEWFKVFIHETFHNFDLDFSKIDNKFSDKYAAEIFPLSIDFRLYESYCETWATIINSIYISYQNLYKNNTYNEKNFINELTNNLNKELNFSFFQCNKILHHFGMNYSDLFANTEQSIFARNNKYKEDTPIISYFFFKTILLFNANLFINWCINTNNNTLNFSNTSIKLHDKIILYANTIKKLRNDEFFKHIVSKNNEFIETKDKRNINDTFYFKTLRMTTNNLFLQ